MQWCMLRSCLRPPRGRKHQLQLGGTPPSWQYPKTPLLNILSLKGWRKIRKLKLGSSQVSNFQEFMGFMIKAWCLFIHVILSPTNSLRISQFEEEFPWFLLGFLPMLWVMIHIDPIDWIMTVHEWINRITYFRMNLYVSMSIPCLEIWNWHSWGYSMEGKFWV